MPDPPRTRPMSWSLSILDVHTTNGCRVRPNWATRYLTFFLFTLCMHSETNTEPGMRVLVHSLPACSVYAAIVCHPSASSRFEPLGH